jgi:DegV family protein with EDD domain
MVAVVTDSAASLPRELAEDLGIGVVPIYLRFGDRVERDDPDAEGFYDRLRTERVSVSTAAPAPGDFLEAFRRTGAEDIVCVTVASSISGIHGSASVAARTAGARVVVVDSGTASMAEGFVALEAARAARDGSGLEEAVAAAEGVAARVRLVAVIDTFEYLRRSGRVNALLSYAGTALRIKPVFRMAGGAIRPVARPRTRGRALDLIAEEARREVSGRRLHVAAVHADAEGDARRLLERVSAGIDVAEAHLAAFTPAMGSHTGPGLVGLAWWCEDRERP